MVRDVPCVTWYHITEATPFRYKSLRTNEQQAKNNSNSFTSWRPQTPNLTRKPSAWKYCNTLRNVAGHRRTIVILELITLNRDKSEKTELWHYTHCSNWVGHCWDGVKLCCSCCVWKPKESKKKDSEQVYSKSGRIEDKFVCQNIEVVKIIFDKTFSSVVLLAECSGPVLFHYDWHYVPDIEEQICSVQWRLVWTSGM